MSGLLIGSARVSTDAEDLTVPARRPRPLDRLARSLPDACNIVEDLTRREVRLNLGGSV